MTEQSNSPKKRKMDLANDHRDEETSKTAPVSFEEFRTTRVLNEDPRSKAMFIEGRFADDDKKAVVILEKTPFSEDTMKKILTGKSDVKVNIQNDIYNTLDLYPPSIHNG